MKILFVTDVAPPLLGGGETYVTQLGTQLTKLGHEIHWLTARMPNTEEYEFFHGIHVHRIPILFKNKFYFPGRQTFPLMLALQKLDFVHEMDVIQTNTLVAGYSGWRLAKKYNKPSLLFCHEFFGELWNKVGNNFLERKVYPKIEMRIARSPYDWFACPSEYSKSTMTKAGSPENKITVIPHGIDHNLFNQQADGKYFRKQFGLEDSQLFGYVGRLRIKSTTQSKNLVTLLKAARIVRDQVPTSRLVLAGAGYEEEMKPIVDKMGLDRYVIYIGNIPYLKNPEFIRMCDVIVCPAVADGFCFLLAEASACGRPVIATNVGAHKERVVHGKTGYLVGITAEEIAKYIVQTLSDKNNIKNLGDEASRNAAGLSWEQSAAKHIDVYEMLTSNNRKNP
ncbi:MAG: glycosyltransferase family 4 protein [Thermoproteota archaeon]|nr:glycosyltransferase family 4 protein [Thermoproteota archaeon]